MEPHAKAALRADNAAYLAGFFDGEGHIRISKHSKRGSYMLQISVVQATLEPLPEFQKAFGGTISSRLTLYRGGKRAIFTWQASSACAMQALRQMFPYLRVKREEACIAEKFRLTFRPQYGDRSKLSEDIDKARLDMKNSLEWFRKNKRQRAFDIACAAG